MLHAKKAKINAKKIPPFLSYFIKPSTDTIFRTLQKIYILQREIKKQETERCTRDQETAQFWITQH